MSKKTAEEKDTLPETLNPKAYAPTYNTAPDMTPTAAEYERDAQLEMEKLQKSLEEQKKHAEAVKNGELPPAAQTLDEARKAREEIERQNKEAQENAIKASKKDKSA